MATQERTPRPETRRARHGTLRWGDWQARKNAHVGFGEQIHNSEHDAGTQDFERWLLNAKIEWSIRSRAGLLGSSGRIGKHDANRALKQEMAKLAEAGDL